MIREEEVFKIGRFTKPHGIKGEIALSFDNDIFDKVECSYLICLIDGIFVPFFVDEYRFKGSETALFILTDINSEEKAKSLCGRDVYFPRKFMVDEEVETDYSWSYFIGFEVEDKHSGLLGIINDVDESTINTLFLIARKNKEDLIIPATDAYITEIDNQNKVLYLDLPDGLIE